jgi:plasmid stability protein
MPDLPLKKIPADLYSRLQSSAAEHFRSLNQEVQARLNRSFDAEDAKMSALHARWVHEALSGGDSTPLKPDDLDKAFARGLARAKNRKTAKAA